MSVTKFRPRLAVKTSQNRPWGPAIQGTTAISNSHQDARVPEYAEGSPVDESAVSAGPEAAVPRPGGAIEAATPSTRPTPPDMLLLFERIKAVACRMGIPAQLAEELASDLMFKWWSQGWDNVRFPAPEKLDGWVRRCLNNWMKTIQKRNARRYHIEKDHAQRADSHPCPMPDAELERQELRPLLLRLVAEEGSANALRILDLRLKGYSAWEIAHQIGRSERTVRDQLARLRKLLRPKLRELGF